MSFEEWKSENIEKILFFLLFIWLGVKKVEKKKSLNKFTHISLLKNDVQLKQKQKIIKNYKKEQSSNFNKKIKIMSKKSHLVKIINK